MSEDNNKKQKPDHTAKDPVSGKYFCACCGYATCDEPGGSGSYEVCKVCNWEDDNVQFNDPDYDGGANDPSLNEARDNFERTGASDEKCKGSCEPAEAGLARDPSRFGVKANDSVPKP